MEGSTITLFIQRRRWLDPSLKWKFHEMTGCLRKIIKIMKLRLLTFSFMCLQPDRPLVLLKVYELRKKWSLSKRNKGAAGRCISTVGRSCTSATSSWFLEETNPFLRNGVHIQLGSFYSTKSSRIVWEVRGDAPENTKTSHMRMLSLIALWKKSTVRKYDSRPRTNYPSLEGKMLRKRKEDGL